MVLRPSLVRAAGPFFVRPVIFPLAESYVSGAAREAGAAAELAASCKEQKYADTEVRYVVEPTAIKILGVLSPSVHVSVW